MENSIDPELQMDKMFYEPFLSQVCSRFSAQGQPEILSIPRRTVQMGRLLEKTKNYMTMPLDKDNVDYISNRVYKLDTTSLQPDEKITDRLLNFKKCINDRRTLFDRGVVLLTLKNQDAKIPIEFQDVFRTNSEGKPIWILYNARYKLIIPYDLIQTIEVVVLTVPATFKKEIQRQITQEIVLSGSASASRAFDENLL